MPRQDGWWETIKYIIVEALKGSRRYYLAAAGLLLLTIYGLYLWIFIQHAPVFLGTDYGGLILTGMNDSVVWGLYISFFVFWVGVAAAGIAFSIAAYVFNHPEFKKIAVLGEVQAISALTIVLMLIVVDLGRPIRALFEMPLLPNLRSMLDWDFIVITTYLLINLVGALVTIHYYRRDKALPKKFLVPFMVIAAPFAIGIHTVTAFISQALTARPIWNSPLLAPRYVATAFAAGPAILLIALYLAERYIEGFSVSIEVYKKTLYLVAGATIVGLYFTLSEAHEIFWYTTEPVKWAQAKELFYGPHLPYLAVLTWLWIGLGVAAVILALIPSTHNSKGAIAFISLLVVVAVIAEKTLTIVIPAYEPSTLGEIRPYHPTPIEYGITLGVHALGLLIYLLLAKPAIKAIMTHYFKPGAHHH
ncbi:polysulfide reductase NrfD [Pyrofollis japonicus]|uniref:NrfD/PsrC family molybdoenzyme membrane anchor subunit n=1 Tax=Pyrofollis japonicus TaxID=3060460 RepID=UPI00295B87BD|nr:NrfD/PsrC family molybdoenzyme membrane anchor subunit [Pyrofollis japonicus]BEP17197.1 polysulfide reductase NrfD [Pyrofollis japonicus]